MTFVDELRLSLNLAESKAERSSATLTGTDRASSPKLEILSERVDAVDSFQDFVASEASDNERDEKLAAMNSSDTSLVEVGASKIEKDDCRTIFVSSLRLSTTNIVYRFRIWSNLAFCEQKLR